MLSHAFSEGAIKNMEKYILGNVRTFTTKLGEKGFSEKDGGYMGEEKGEGEWSKPQNMADWSNYLTFDVMGDLCFGKAFEMLEREENRHVIDLIGNAAHMHLIVCPPSPSSLPLFLPHSKHKTQTNEVLTNSSEQTPSSKPWA